MTTRAISPIIPLDDSPLLNLGNNVVVTPFIQDLTDRALSYLEVGYPVHFSGPAGTGKTTLAFHIAAQLGRPVMLIHGDDEFGRSDLIGKDSGYHKSTTVDNYIHDVVRTEENMNVLWADNRLTTACKHGYTLIYDEFTRSKPEANNVFLSILEEKILNMPGVSGKENEYLVVHPDFRVIFTSNPEEYAGVHKKQDALMDRLISVCLGHFDRETEIKITMAKSNIARSDAKIIVDLIREMRNYDITKHSPSIRSCIAIARILVHRGCRAKESGPIFRQICRDVLSKHLANITQKGHSRMGKK